MNIKKKKRFEGTHLVCKKCNLTLLLDRFDWPKNRPSPKSHIDHCHNSNIIRGILCNYCNLGLGFFKDNIGNLKEAITYLEKSKLIEDKEFYLLKSKN